MLIRIRHETTHDYGAPVKAAIQRLLLTPRSFIGQQVRSWRIEIDRDCRLYETEDAFGNIAYRFYAEGPFQTLTTTVEGEVETFATAGVVSGAPERFPLQLYLRDTPLTHPDAGVVEFAKGVAAREKTSLARLHALMSAVYGVMSFEDDATHAATSATQAFDSRRGVCQDFAHLFIACARAIEIPARCVSGYFCRADGATEQAAGHAWAEAYVEDLGWVGFDPAHGISPNEAYVRVAVALDYLGAAPIRGARTGGGMEAMAVKLRIDTARLQSQS